MKRTLTIFGCFLTFFLFDPLAQAQLTDNLDSYTTGNINGQGSWVETLNGGTLHFTVTTAQAQTSPNSVSIGLDFHPYIEKSFTNNSAGEQEVWFYATGVADSASVRLYDNGVEATRFLVATDMRCYYSGSLYDDMGAVTANAWHSIEIAWDTSKGAHGQTRCRFDSGAWSSWRDPYGTLTDGVDKVHVVNDSNTATVYYDSFSSGPAATGPSYQLWPIGTLF